MGYDFENRTISADISSPGIYFVFDFMQWVQSLGIEPVETAQSKIFHFYLTEQGKVIRKLRTSNKKG